MKNLLPFPLMMLFVICAAAVFCNVASAGFSTTQADKEGMEDAFEDCADEDDVKGKYCEDFAYTMDWTHENMLAKEKRDWIETFPFQDIAFYRAASDIIGALDSKLRALSKPKKNSCPRCFSPPKTSKSTTNASRF